MGPDAWTRGQLAEELGRPGGIFLVDEVLRGFVIAWLVFDELNLLQIGVDPAARRAGLATALHAALWAAAPHATVGWLEVRADNEPARRFYAREGWRELGRRPRYYADGSDAVLYRRG